MATSKSTEARTCAHPLPAGTPRERALDAADQLALTTAERILLGEDFARIACHEISEIGRALIVIASSKTDAHLPVVRALGVRLTSLYVVLMGGIDGPSDHGGVEALHHVLHAGAVPFTDGGDQ